MFIENDDEILGYDVNKRPVLMADFRRDYNVLKRITKWTVAGNSVKQRSRFMESVSFQNRLNVRCRG